MSKICTICKVNKDLEDFSKSPKAKDGRNTQCKECLNKKRRKKYNEDPEYKEKKDQSVKDGINAKREFVYQYLLEHPCVDCGEDDPVVLEFDHRGDKVDSISELMVRRGLEVLKEEIKKCDVRCANCHRKKTAKDFNYYNYTRQQDKN